MSEVTFRNVSLFGFQALHQHNRGGLKDKQLPKKQQHHSDFFLSAL
jgi:hypothetical protein